MSLGKSIGHERAKILLKFCTVVLASGDLVYLISLMGQSFANIDGLDVNIVVPQWHAMLYAYGMASTEPAVPACCALNARPS